MSFFKKLLGQTSRKKTIQVEPHIYMKFKDTFNEGLTTGNGPTPPLPNRDDDENEYVCVIFTYAILLALGSYKIDDIKELKDDFEKHMEAKVGIVFTDERANLSKGRNLLLNKQYVGTFDESSKFSQKLFCCATEMGVDDKTELIILGDGARWISRIAETQYPNATLILDWWHLSARLGNCRLAQGQWTSPRRCPLLGTAVD